MSHPRVLVLHNVPVLPADHPDRGSEEDVLYSAKVVADSLKESGIPNNSFGVTDDLSALLARLQVPDYDVVFNLYEGTADRPITEVYFTGLLEWLNIPYTGCPSFTLSVARNKPLSKRLFASAGLRTAEFMEFNTPEVSAWSTFPALVKPATEDASVGIDQASVVSTPAELQQRVSFVLDSYGPPAMVEQYIPGREIQISVLDLKGDNNPVVLPFSEIAFNPSVDGRPWPIYTYTAKWHENSEEFKHADVRVGVELPPETSAALKDTAIRAYHLLGGRDYARVDTRLTPEGEVFLLEMNPNPSIYSVMIDSGLPKVGYDYNMFIAAMVRNASDRWPNTSGSRRVRS